MKTVTSKDGTKIAYDQVGAGPAVILVGGAIQHRAVDPNTAKLADLLAAAHFTGIHYDRRGRGDSTDTLPFAIEREIEDIDALIEAVGGSAFLFGMSSGGALVLEAAIRLGAEKVRKIAIYEVPYNPEGRERWQTYRRDLSEALAAGNKGEALAVFMKLVGTPDEAVAGVRNAPVWGMLEKVAPTLAYDAAALGDDWAVPAGRARLVPVPALLLNGEAGFPFMGTTAVALAQAMPKGEHQVLEGQTHDVSPDVLAPVLATFFAE